MLYRSTFLATTALAVGLAVAPLAAIGGSISVNYNGAEFPDFQAVDVERGGSSEGGIAAGAFSFTEDGTTNSFVAWCLDLDTTISQSKPQPFTYTEAPNLLSSAPYSNPNAQKRLESLFDANNGGGDISNKNQSAAFQLAVWDVIYDADFDIDAGNLDASGTNGTILNLAQGYLDNIGTYGGGRVWNVVTYNGVDANGKDIQDIGVATAIPLPAAAWLLLAVSGGLVAAKRRQLKKAA